MMIYCVIEGLGIYAMLVRGTWTQAPGRCGGKSAVVPEIQ